MPDADSADSDLLFLRSRWKVVSEKSTINKKKRYFPLNNYNINNYLP